MKKWSMSQHLMRFCKIFKILSNSSHLVSWNLFPQDSKFWFESLQETPATKERQEWNAGMAAFICSPLPISFSITFLYNIQEKEIWNENINQLYRARKLRSVCERIVNFDRIEYLNYSDPIIRIIRIIRNTFKRLRMVQIVLKKGKNS